MSGIEGEEGAIDVLPADAGPLVSSPHGEAGALATLEAPSGSSYRDPVGAYLATLTTDKSRKTAIERMRAIARCLGTQTEDGDHEAWRRIPWTALTYAETNMVRAVMVSTTKPATARLTMSVLKRVLRSAWRLRLMGTEQYHRAVDLDPVPGGSKRPGREIQDEDIKKLELRFAELEPPYRQMARAVFAVGLGAGLRREEIARIPLAGVEAEHLVFVGKGRKEARQPLAPWARPILQDWIEARAAEHFRSLLLFVRYDPAGQCLVDAPLTPIGAWELVVRESQAAEIPKITTHDLRRTFITRAIRMDPFHAKTLARHADMGTTELYDRRADDDAKAMLDRSPPMMGSPATAWDAFVDLVKKKAPGRDPLEASAQAVIYFLRTRADRSRDAEELIVRLQRESSVWTGEMTKMVREAVNRMAAGTSDRA